MRIVIIYIKYLKQTKRSYQKPVWNLYINFGSRPSLSEPFIEGKGRETSIILLYDDELEKNKKTPWSIGVLSATGYLEIK